MLCCLVLGNTTLMLVAGVSLVWVARDRRPILAGSAAGAMIVLKVWLWPVFVFFLLTRRFLAAWTTAVWAVVGICAWWLLSPDTFYAYDEQTRETVAAFGHFGMGVLSIAVNEGATVQTAEVLTFAAGAVVLVIAWRATGDLARSRFASRRRWSRRRSCGLTTTRSSSCRSRSDPRGFRRCGSSRT